jgi:hypothetical protein
MLPCVFTGDLVQLDNRDGKHGGSIMQGRQTRTWSARARAKPEKKGENRSHGGACSLMYGNKFLIVSTNSVDM